MDLWPRPRGALMGSQTVSERLGAGQTSALRRSPKMDDLVDH